MKPTLQAPLLVMLAGMSLLACGGATKQQSSTTPRTPSAPAVTIPLAAPSTPSTGAYQKNDGDTDDRLPLSQHVERDDQMLLGQYKTKADRSTTRAIAAVVKRYYAAAAAGDTVTVCSLLNKDFASQLAGGQSQARPAGREACVRAVAPLLEQQRQQFVEDEPSTMLVLGARLKGESAIALLGFRKAPESSILVQREGKGWAVGVLSGTELP